MTRNRMAAAAATIALAALVGCGGDDGGGGADSAGGGKAIENAKTIDVGSMDGAKGEIKYCQGKDTTGETKAWGKQFNEKYKSQGLSVKIIEFPASADEQRTQFVQRQEAKSGDCDVFRSDVIWTAEFASQGWLYDLTPYIEDRRDEFIQPAIDTATYEGKIWGVPHYTNAALLYYRKDKIDQAPATWQEVYQQAGDKGGIVFQGAAYEGLTCDWLEIAFAAGGTVLSEDGKKATIDSPENVAATKLMADAVKSGAAPKAVATYMEPESLTAWQTGKPAMMRNWPYAYGAQPGHAQAQGQVRRRAAARVRGRRQGRDPRRRQQRRLRLLEEPGRGAGGRRLPRPAGVADPADGGVLAGVAAEGHLRPARGQEGDPVLGRPADRRSSRPSRARSRRSIRRSRRRSTRTSTRRSWARCRPRTR